MVEVGDLVIKGAMDTSDIDRGTDRVSQKMDALESNVASTQSTFSRLSETTGQVASHFATPATVGVGALTAMAATSPQVAPAMAQIANETRKISFAMGERLTPLFESVANDLIPAIGTAIENFTPQINQMVETGTEGVQDISSVLKGEWSEIENIIPKSSGLITGAAAGFRFGGFKGMLLGAALGYAVGDFSADNYEEPTETGQDIGVRQNLQGTPASREGMMERADLMAQRSPFLFASASTFLDPLTTFFNNLLGDTDDKQRLYSGSERQST